MRAIALIALLAASPATAQLTNPPAAATVDTSMLATKAEADQAKAMADTAAQTAASAAAVAAAACQPIAAIPPVEVPGGTPGTGTNCRLANAANNRISRTGLFTISTGGAILCAGSPTCTWLDTAGNPMPLPAGFASYPMFFTAIGTAGSATVRCKVASTSNTGFVGATCTQAVATVSILGAAVEIVAPAGTQVFALSLPATQANR